MSDIVQYTNLLHRHRDTQHPEVVAFVQNCREDQVLQRRILQLNQLWEMSEKASYTPQIATAAREYAKAREKFNRGGSPLDRDKAMDKLLWLIDAEKHGWKPEDYQWPN